MKILVTGGAGFIASHIVDQLISEGHSVVVVDNLSTGSRENVNPKCTFFKADITGEGLAGLFNGIKPEVVIHHAAQVDVQVSQKEPVFDSTVNILGTLNVLKCCVNVGVKKIIYASSAAVYGAPQYLPIDEQHPVQPISNYGISKFTPELYIQAFHKNYGLNFTILRYANVYGPRQGLKGEGGVIYLFARQFQLGKPPVIFGDGKQTRDFIFVGDIVQANVLALTKGDAETINIGAGVRVSVNELYEQYKKIWGTDLPAQFAAPRSGDIDHSVFDIQRAHKVLGWRPSFFLEEGLRETVQYYKALEKEV